MLIIVNCIRKCLNNLWMVLSKKIMKSWTCYKDKLNCSKYLKEQPNV